VPPRSSWAEPGSAVFDGVPMQAGGHRDWRHPWKSSCCRFCWKLSPTCAAHSRVAAGMD